MSRKGVTIEIKPHRDYPKGLVTIVVTTPNGLCYACTWNGNPSEAEALEAWRTDRKSFTPYNAATGDY